MKRQWHLYRTTLETTNGQQRWDQAYQLLLRWSQANPTPAMPLRPPALPFPEVSHESRRVRARIDIPSSPVSDD